MNKENTTENGCYSSLLDKIVMQNQIRLKIHGESFWAYRYQDLPENQAEVNNHLLIDTYSFGDRVEFDENRNVTRLVKTRAEVTAELKA